MYRIWSIFTGCLAQHVLKLSRFTILCRVQVLSTYTQTERYFSILRCEMSILINFYVSIVQMESVKRWFMLLTAVPIFPRRKTCSIRLRQDRSETTNSDAIEASFIKLSFSTSVDVVCINFRQVAPIKTIFVVVNSPLSQCLSRPYRRYRNRHTEAPIYIVVVKDTYFPKARTNLI